MPDSLNRHFVADDPSTGCRALVKVALQQMLHSILQFREAARLVSVLRARTRLLPFLVATSRLKIQSRRQWLDSFGVA
jgi:hypothetical protein